MNEFTPVECINKIYFKRDDYYKPYIDVPICGGKVRQCISLIENNIDIIRDKYNSRISTASSVHSPQGIIVARVAKEYNLKSLLAIGGKFTLESALSKHKNLRICKNLGCDVRVVSGISYNRALYSKLNQIDKDEGLYYQVLFGMNISNNVESIVGVTEKQTLNLPTNLDNLVIPVGSGITAGGILTGIIKNNNRPKKIVLVQIAGFDRNDVIESILKLYGISIVSVDDTLITLSNGWEYTYIKYDTYPYSKWLKNSFEVDGRYESKALDYLMNNIDYKNEKTLFWIIGNSKDVLY